MTVIRQNSDIKGHHEFHVRSHKDLDANNGDSYSLINKSNLIAALFKIKGTLLGKKKIYEWWEVFAKGDVVFWVVAPCHAPLPCQV